jgi:hypothetical protein
MIFKSAFQVIDSSPVTGILGIFFDPFLTHNCLISSQLQTNHGLFSHLYGPENGFCGGRRRSIEAQIGKGPRTQQGD